MAQMTHDTAESESSPIAADAGGLKEEIKKLPNELMSKIASNVLHSPQLIEMVTIHRMIVILC